MTRLLSATSALALFSALTAGTPVLAQAPAVNVDPTAVQSGSYVVEPAHTQITFNVLHMGFTHYEGRLTDASGTLELSAKTPAQSAIEVSVPVASVSTTSAKLDGELKSKDWLDAATYPTVTFKSKSIAPTGKGEAKVTGDLTIHGVTKPVTLTAHFVGSGVNPLSKKYTVGFDITGDIRRSDFGVKTYVPLISDTVHLTIAGAFEQK